MSLNNEFGLAPTSVKPMVNGSRHDDPPFDGRDAVLDLGTLLAVYGAANGPKIG